MTLNARQRALIHKVETTPGTFVSPDVPILYLTDTLRVVPAAGQNIERTVRRASLDSLKSLRAGDYATIEFETELAIGPGTTAPPWGGLLLACAVAETVRSGTSTYDAAFTSGSYTIVLGTGASTTDGAYVGRTVNITGLHAGANGKRLITKYTGSTKECELSPVPTSGSTATGSAQFVADVAYSPVSTFGTESSCSFVYREPADDGASYDRYRFRYGRGDVSFTFTEQQILKAKFSFQALLHDHETINSAPSDLDYSAWETPDIPTEDNCEVYNLLGFKSAILQGFEFMAGVQVRPIFRANQTRIDAVDRAPTGRITVESPAIGDVDLISALTDSTTGLLHLAVGTEALGILTFFAPAAQITSSPSHDNTDGVVTSSMDMAFRAATLAGNDSWQLIQR